MSVTKRKIQFSLPAAKKSRQTYRVKLLKIEESKQEDSAVTKYENEVEPSSKRILLDHDYTNREFEEPVHCENGKDSSVTKYENEKLVKMIEYKITFKKFYQILYAKFGKKLLDLALIKQEFLNFFQINCPLSKKDRAVLTKKISWFTTNILPTLQFLAQDDNLDPCPGEIKFTMIDAIEESLTENFEFEDIKPEIKEEPVIKQEPIEIKTEPSDTIEAFRNNFEFEDVKPEFKVELGNVKEFSLKELILHGKANSRSRTFPWLPANQAAIKVSPEKFLRNNVCGWAAQLAGYGLHYKVEVEDNDDLASILYAVETIIDMNNKVSSSNLDSAMKKKPDKWERKIRFRISPPDPTGFVGLKKQSPIPYMNSLLQILYFINNFRKCVYKMPKNPLQRLFYDLQVSNGHAVNTKDFIDSLDMNLTKQSEIPEFLQYLFSKLSDEMIGTSMEDTIPKLFEGKMQNMDETWTKPFYNIELIPDLRHFRDINQAFKQAFTKKRTHFTLLPPVLFLYINRSKWNESLGKYVKTNQALRFYKNLELSDFYIDQDHDKKEHYVLHAVLAHSGDWEDGHYVSYIDPLCQGRFYKFDDEVVTECTVKEAVQFNYGGRLSGLTSGASSACMLVYIRQSSLENIFCPVTEDDIPKELSKSMNIVKQEG